MAEMISEAQKIDQENGGIHEIDVTIDEAELANFAETLKGNQYSEIREFLKTLRARIDTINTQAEVFRMKKEGAAFNQGNVGGLSIAPTGTSPEIDIHNQEVQRIIEGINAFRGRRDEFLSNFAMKYMPTYLRDGYERRRMEEHNRNLRTQPRVARQFGPNFIATSGETTPVSRQRPEDDKEYMQALLDKDVDSLSDDEIDIIRGMYQKAGYKDIYEKFITAGKNERDALKKMRVAMKEVNARDNSTPFNQALIAMARWLENKSKR